MHQGYVGVYGQQALTFINSKLGSESGGGGDGGGDNGGGQQRGWRQRWWSELRGEMGSVWRAGVDGAYVLPVWEHLQVERDLVLPVPVGLSETHLCQPIFVSREYSRLVIDILLIECYNAYSSSKLLV